MSYVMTSILLQTISSLTHQMDLIDNETNVCVRFLAERRGRTARYEPRTVRSELSAHLSDCALFRRASISLDRVPRGICTKVMGYVGWEDEGLSVRWLWACGCVDANPIEPGDEDETRETPCENSGKVDEEEWPMKRR